MSAARYSADVFSKPFNLLLGWAQLATQLARCLQQSSRVEVLVVMCPYGCSTLDEDDVAPVISAVGSSHGTELATLTCRKSPHG